MMKKNQVARIFECNSLMSDRVSAVSARELSAEVNLVLT